MLYNVAGLLKSFTGDTRTVELNEWLNVGEPDVQLITPITGAVHLTRDPAGILVHGKLSTDLRVPCARCLAPAECLVDVELVEAFRPTVYLPGGPEVRRGDEGEADTEIDQHHQLDLTEVLRQAILLAVPLHPLCRPDCRGLCVTCGQDLNDGPCGCEPAPDPRWQALRALLDEE